MIGSRLVLAIQGWGLIGLIAIGLTITPTPTEPPATPTITATITASPTPERYPASLDITGFATLAIDRWQKLKLVPDGGRLLFITESAFGKTSDPNYSQIAIGRNLSARNFVVNAAISWNAIGAGSGCGVLFRSDGLSNNAIALLGQDRTLSLLHFEGDGLPLRYQEPTALFEPGKSTILTLIAIENAIAVYINGSRATIQTTPGTVIRGGFSLVVYNPGEARNYTDCRFRNVWVWSFDGRDSGTATPPATFPATVTP